MNHKLLRFIATLAVIWIWYQTFLYFFPWFDKQEFMIRFLTVESIASFFIWIILFKVWDLLNYHPQR